MEQNNQNLLVLLLLPLLPVLLLGGATDPSVSRQFQFRQDPACPPAAGVAASMRLQGVQSYRTCSIECAVRPDCAVYTFAKASGECLMGSTADLLNSWTTDPTTPCASQLNPRLPGILTFRSKLLAFLDFRIGRDNLVGSEQFKAVQHSPNVSFIPGFGALFPTQSANYIELRKDGGIETIQSLFARGRNFSVYARVNRLAGRNQWYFMFTDCVQYNQMRGGLIYLDNRTGMFHSMESPQEIQYRRSADPNPDPIGVTNVDSSMGSVFSVNNFTGAYFNGALHHVETMYVHADMPSFTAVPECIRLGYTLPGDDSKGLVGRYICFAVANVTLTAAEFAELDKLCS